MVAEKEVPEPKTEIPAVSAAPETDPIDTAVETTPTFQPHKKIWPLVVWFLGIVLVVDFLSFITFRNFFSKKSVNQTPVSATPTPVLDETAGWETYTNKKYGYSLDVPQDMKLVEENKALDTSTEATKIQSLDYKIDDSACKGGCSYPVTMGWQLSISVQANWQSGYNKDFFKKSPPLKLPGILFEEEKIVDGIKMLITERTRADLPDLGNTDWYADFTQEGKWYRITYSCSANNKSKAKDTFDQILSTFKFTD